MMNNAQRAWAAGFFEGEGSIRCNITDRRNDYRTMTLDIVQVNREPLERFQRIFPKGKIYGPYLHAGRTRTHYRYVSHRSKVTQAIFRSMSRWLSKRRKAQFKKAVTRCSQRRG